MQLRFRFYGRSKVKMCSSVTTLLPQKKVKSITYYHLTLFYGDSKSHCPFSRTAEKSKENTSTTEPK